MQNVLSLDISSSPAELLVSRIDGNLLEVIEHRSVTLPTSFSPTALQNPGIFSAVPTPVANEDTPEINAPSATEIFSPLQDALDSLRSSWSTVVLVIPSLSGLATNVKLPFGDQKNIAKIVDLEVQDLVPFDIDEFVIHHHSLGIFKGVDSLAASTKESFDVHISLIPRNVVSNALTLCRQLKLEPLVITTPAGAVSGVYHLAKSYFKDNSAVILSNDPDYAIVALIDGEVRVERSLSRNTTQDQETSFRGLFTELRLTIASFERRYGKRIEHVYSLGRVEKLSALQQILGRPVESFNIGDVLKAKPEARGLSAIAAIFAKDDSPPAALNNFRSGEFAYRAKLDELLKMIRTCSPWIFAAVFSIVLAVAVRFWSREYYISSINNEIAKEAQQIIAGFSAPDGNVINAIREQEVALSNALGALSSPSKITPLDAFVAISNDMPSDIPDLYIKMVKIDGARVHLEGVMPDLSSRDKIEKALKQNTASYARVDAKAETASATGKGYGFSVDIVLNQ